MATALVTGGTAGIGNAFVRAFAARGDDVVIVARDTARMQQIAQQLTREHGIRVECLTADLSRRDDLDAVAARIEDASHPVDVVVNNAGFGLHQKLTDPDTDLQRRAMDVMCFAVLVLSGAAARAMTARGHGQIINVSSTSAWIMSGNYSAIKAWVLRYTEGLAVELRGTGVTATALCPGWVHTEFHDRAGISAKNLPDIVWIDADDLVAECLRDADAGRTVSIPTFKWKVAIAIAQYGPRSFIEWFSGKLSSSRHSQKSPSVVPMPRVPERVARVAQAAQHVAASTASHLRHVSGAAATGVSRATPPAAQEERGESHS